MGMAFSKVCGCLNKPNCFYYVCGKFKPKAKCKTISPLMKNAYKLYFGCALGDQDKMWVPHICCISCAEIRRVDKR
jgi:hypothetical protein